MGFASKHPTMDPAPGNKSDVADKKTVRDPWLSALLKGTKNEGTFVQVIETISHLSDSELFDAVVAFIQQLVDLAARRHGGGAFDISIVPVLNPDQIGSGGCE